MSPMVGSKLPPSFAPSSFPSLAAQLSVVPPPVSSAVLPSATAATASKPHLLSFADVLKSNPASSRGRKLVAPTPASATAPLDASPRPFRLLKGRRRTQDSGVVVAQPFTPAPAPVVDSPGPRQSSRRGLTTPASAPRSYADAVKGKGAGTGEGAQPTKRGVSRAIVQPEPVVQPLTAQQETELLQKQIKAQFLKEHAEEAKEKKDFIEKEKEIVEKILEQPERAAEAMSAATPKKPTISEPSMGAIMTGVEEIKEEEKQEKIEVMTQEIEMRQEMETQKKRRRGAAMSAAELLVSGKETRVDASIPVFQDYTPEQIRDFILTQFPPDAISVLDNFGRLSPQDQKEILDFIILKYKAVTLNTPTDAPGAVDDVYNKLGIKSLPLQGNMFTGIPSATGILSSATALLVCDVDPSVCPPASDWCCCLSRRDGDRDFTEIAALIKEQGLPFVAANPDIQDMMARCRQDDIRVQVSASAAAASAAASAAAASAAAAAGAGGEDPDPGFDDPFPSVIIGDKKIVYSIGPILDAEPILGRALIMVRIHNYKTQDYPNGIYFWVYPSFSEGGANRVFLIIGNGQFMKGPDYTLTTFILDLLQVHINKYYTKHFVNKQGPGFIPTTLLNQQDVVCFFGGMRHLQSLWVHDLIEGRGVNLRPNPLGPVPASFNRHCYRFGSSLHGPVRVWLKNGIPDVESFTYTDEAAFFATQFRAENQTYTGQRVYNSFPLSCCLTTIFHKFRDVRKTDVNDFFALLKRWPDTLFVQGSEVVPGVSPLGCVVAGTPTKIAGMRYNIFIEHLAPLLFVKKFKSLRIVPPISTPETGQQFTMAGRMGRRGLLTKKLTLFGAQDVEETCLMVVDLEPAADAIRRLQIQRGPSAVIDEHQQAVIIFGSLPQALQTTINNISAIFFQPGLFPLLSAQQRDKIKLCFKSFLGMRFDSPNADELKRYIIMQGVDLSRDGSGSIAIAKDAMSRVSPLYRLIRTMETGIYRHLIMSSILDEYTQMPSYPLNIPRDFNQRLNPIVSCAFLNSDGQYVELPGGLGAGQLGNCDFSGIFEHPLFDPYIFSATRKSMAFPPGILERYMQDPQRVYPQTAVGDATIPVKVHTKMFLLRLVFSTTFGAIQIVVCVSSTICVASPVGGQPHISFGVDAQFNVVSIGPINTGQGGSMSTDATILATMCDYFSLGCMGAAKKGEYSLTAGYQQFFDYFDNFFRVIMTECVTYVSAYISPFNCRTDLVMKHFCRVFENVGDNHICAAIRGMWGWWDYLQRVQPEVCVVGGGITDVSIETAITSGRRDMQIVVQALLDPIMGAEDAQAVGEVTGSVTSEQSTPRGQADTPRTPRTPRTPMSSSSVPRSPSSVSGSLSSVSGSPSPAARLFGQFQRDDSFGSYTSGESYRPGAGSQSDYSSSGSSAAPSMSPIHQPFFPGPGIAEGVEQPISNGGRGGTNKKTRKYRTSHRSKSRSRSKTGGNRNRNTRKNTQVSKTKIKTMKIKSKKFPKRIYLYSTPRTAQRMAYKYLGRIKTAKLYPARNPAKKYMVFDPKNNKWVNFGQMGYEDYTKHHDKTRRKNYLTRTKGMLGDWKSNKYSANNLSRSILWN
jgi:hypothetical protein